MWKIAYIALLIVHTVFLAEIGKYAFYTIPAMVVLGLIIFGPVIRNVIHRR